MPHEEREIAIAFTREEWLGLLSAARFLAPPEYEYAAKIKAKIWAALLADNERAQGKRAAALES